MSNFSLPPHTSLLPLIGWREWIIVPDLFSLPVKAKIDTGARSSSIHALNITPVTVDGRECVQFETKPIQRSSAKLVQCVAPVDDIRHVRSSSGQESLRYVIVTPVRWKGMQWDVELTLADRSKMGFRMLLGREALRKRLLVNPAASFLGGRIKKKETR